MSQPESAIVDAIFNGDPDFVRAQVAARPELCRGVYLGKTLLHHAARSPNSQVIRVLIAGGSDVDGDVEENGTDTPLCVAAASKYPDNVRVLLEAGADPNIGEPIVEVIAGDHQPDPVAVIRLLEQHGADIHAVYPYGSKKSPMNALLLAESFGMDDVVAYLRSRGARPPAEYPPGAVDASLHPVPNSPGQLTAELESQVVDAILDGNFAIVRQHVTAHPELCHGLRCGGTLLHHAAKSPNAEIVRFLIKRGADLNAVLGHLGSTTPLSSATPHLANVRLLLEAGADPRINQPICKAIVTRHSPDRLEIVKLLEAAGADIHVVYPYGATMKPMNPLLLAESLQRLDVVTYLRSRGARPPAEYPPGTVEAYLSDQVPPLPFRVADSGGIARPLQDATATPIPKAERPASNAAEIPIPNAETVEYFRQHFGPVDALAAIEIVPSDPAIAVHFIPTVDGVQPVTLFTTGLATEPMIPNGQAATDFVLDEYSFAELFIQLPAGWNYRDFKDPRNNWPVHWLRQLARWPHAKRRSFGGPTAVFKTGGPIAPGLPFEGLLLISERHYEASDGRMVRLFRLLPLYPEEIALEKSRGAPALMRAFDKHGTPFVVDLKRKNTAK